jgi:hypothetical protein
MTLAWGSLLFSDVFLLQLLATRTDHTRLITDYLNRPELAIELPIVGIMLPQTRRWRVISGMKGKVDMLLAQAIGGESPTA